MTAVVLPTEPATRATAVRTLALVEARRYVRHPVFLAGAVLLAVLTLTQGEPDASVGDTAGFPALALGVFGVLVGHQLTRSMNQSTEAVGSAPIDGVARTAALCLACLVPGVLALVWLAWTVVLVAGAPIPEAVIGDSERAAMLLRGVVAAVGGPLLGVLVGRWTRSPGAGVVAVIGLFAWALIGQMAFALPASWLATLAHLNAPFASWIYDSETEPRWLWGGSPWWHLGYMLVLCGCAAVAAMLHEATGARRTRLQIALAVLGVLAIACLVLAVAPDPTRIPL
jgi:hypothetical protein